MTRLQYPDKNGSDALFIVVVIDNAVFWML